MVNGNEGGFLGRGRFIRVRKGSVQFSKNICAKKSAKLFQFVDDKMSNDDLPKNSCYFNNSPIFYTVKKRGMTIYQTTLKQCYRNDRQY